MEQFHGTTIVSVRRGDKVALGGDGQVTLGNIVMKGGAKKVRRIYNGQVLVGFAGGTADAFSLLDRFEADRADARIEFDVGPHPHRAMSDAAFQGALAAPINVLDREVAFGGRGFTDGFGDRALFDAAAVEDAGLVEMNMRLDQTGAGQTSAGVEGFSSIRQSPFDGCDLAVGDANIERPFAQPVRDPSTANNQIHARRTLT